VKSLRAAAHGIVLVPPGVVLVRHLAQLRGGIAFLLVIVTHRESGSGQKNQNQQRNHHCPSLGRAYHAQAPCEIHEDLYFGFGTELRQQPAFILRDLQEFL
jgi:hypothetical protein